MPVTSTEVDIRFRRPPHDVFGIDPFAVRDSLRFRIWPETEVGLTLAGKKPGAGMEPLLEDLTFVRRPHRRGRSPAILFRPSRVRPLGTWHEDDLRCARDPAPARPAWN
jgi:glucose-6-phosphate 1-dehydrogenase